jgi:hypothetical protein
MRRSLSVSGAAVCLLTACVSTPAVRTPTAADLPRATPLAPEPVHAAAELGACVECTGASNGLTPDVSRALESRLAELTQMGGPCAQYGAVLADSYRSGRITIRPYMWRVGERLTSGAASLAGDMILARHIDSLNVGVRTVDDLVWSMEHEAAHIAFRIVTGVETREDRANNYVRACRGRSN